MTLFLLNTINYILRQYSTGRVHKYSMYLNLIIRYRLTKSLLYNLCNTCVVYGILILRNRNIFYIESMGHRHIKGNQNISNISLNSLYYT